jgi:ATP-dependent DNA helicase RecQ
MGQPKERIVQNRHDQLSTFGIGDLDANEWRSLFRQLIALGYLYADVDNYGALKMSPGCKPLLNGEQQLRVRKFEKTRKTKTPVVGKSAKDLSSADTPLFDALRLHRSQLAKEQGVPPYVILHDKTLAAICEQRPDNTDELSMIPGIGARKLELYGDELISITRQFAHDEANATEELDA